MVLSHHVRSRGEALRGDLAPGVYSALSLRRLPLGSPSRILCELHAQLAAVEELDRIGDVVDAMMSVHSEWVDLSELLQWEPSTDDL